MTSFSGLKRDPVSEIFNTCNCAPDSCGIKLVIKEKSIDMESLIKSFGIKKEAGYSIDFKDNYISFNSCYASGYFEHLPEEGAYILFFESKDKKDSPASLKDRAIAQSSYFNDCNYYVFQKGKLENNNYNDKIINKIKDLNGYNISCENISNGWNAVFKIDNSPYMGVIKDNGKLINYQCALMEYKSGRYLIVGSPIIPITY